MSGTIAPLTDEQEQQVELMDQLASVFSETAQPTYDRLNEMQRKFAACFVLLGGNATKAAQAAGYASPDTSGMRLLVHPRVSELIKLLSLAQAQACLPVAIQALQAIATDDTADIKTRRNAALDLVKIAGGMPQAGPTTAVQINQSSGKDDGSGQSMSIVLQNVLARRDERELSRIPASMPDTIEHHTDTDDAPDPDA